MYRHNHENCISKNYDYQVCILIFYNMCGYDSYNEKNLYKTLNSIRDLNITLKEFE